MAKKNKKSLVPLSIEKPKIYSIRGELVVLDENLATFFGVDTRALNQAVKRNRQKFPEDFYFQLTQEESLKCQNDIVSYGGRRTLPFVFTETGCWTASMILRSEKSNSVAVELMRTFRAMKDHLKSHPELSSAKVQALLSSPNSTINVINPTGPVTIISGSKNQVTQHFSSKEDILKVLEQILPELKQIDLSSSRQRKRSCGSDKKGRRRECSIFNFHCR